MSQERQRRQSYTSSTKSHMQHFEAETTWTIDMKSLVAYFDSSRLDSKYELQPSSQGALNKLPSLYILQVVLVELCKDRIGLMLNPDGPGGVQLWNARQIRMPGLPTADYWPSEADLLSGMSILSTLYPPTVLLLAMREPNSPASVPQAQTAL